MSPDVMIMEWVFPWETSTQQAPTERVIRGRGTARGQRCCILAP